jgi:hypothetical protein
MRRQCLACDLHAHGIAVHVSSSTRTTAVCNHGLSTTVSRSDTNLLTVAFSHSGRRKRTAKGRLSHLTTVSTGAWAER